MTRDGPAVDDHTGFALDATDTGLWEWDLDTGMLSYHDSGTGGCSILLGSLLGGE
jgi:hypothetical protein